MSTERTSTTDIDGVEMVTTAVREPKDKQPETETNLTTSTNRLRLLLSALSFCLCCTTFITIDHHRNVEDTVKTTLSVMGIHLIIEHVLETLLIIKFPPQSLMLYTTTACIRDIINNAVMTGFYLFDDYAKWWVPVMWGCYMADLVMLISKWQYFKPVWLRTVFCHHFGVGLLVLVLNYTTKILTDEILVCIIIYMNSNTAGCLNPIWRAFKWPYSEHAGSICFVLQRVVRFASYGLAARVDSDLFVEENYMYVVLVIGAAVIDAWDIYAQGGSVWRFYKKRILETEATSSISSIPQSQVAQ